MPGGVKARGAVEERAPPQIPKCPSRSHTSLTKCRPVTDFVVLTMFLKSVISQACSCVVAPATAFVTTSPLVATNTINVVQMVNQATTQTAYTTSVSTVAVGTAVDEAVFQQIDAGLNCPGFGGSATPITVVNTADIYGCINACFSNLSF